MTQIKLYEFGPTRSSKCRWALLEAGLEYDSIGNDAKIIGSAEVKAIHPMGKVPAAIVNDQPLFESNAIVAAIADLAPEQNLIAVPGTPERAIHDQWAFFAATELEGPAMTAFANIVDFMLPEEARVPAIVPQKQAEFTRAAAALEQHLQKSQFMMGDAFTVTDIIVGHAANTGGAVGFLKEGFPAINQWLDTLAAREHAFLYGRG